MNTLHSVRSPSKFKFSIKPLSQKNKFFFFSKKKKYADLVDFFCTRRLGHHFPEDSIGVTLIPEDAPSLVTNEDLESDQSTPHESICAVDHPFFSKSGA